MTRVLTRIVVVLVGVLFVAHSLNAQVPSYQYGHCVVRVGDGTKGSGTFVAIRDNGTGLVITCAHLFSGARHGIICTFPDGTHYGGKFLESMPRGLDIAAIAIGRPRVPPVPIGAGVTQVLIGCGYGPNNYFRPVAGYYAGSDMTGNTIFNAVVRQGDSGGAVLDSAGRFVGVVWGNTPYQTYAICGQPVFELIARHVHVQRGSPYGYMF